MSMVTSCPACTTTFRVQPEQLKQRQGKVRCGQCAGVFDAFKSLATLADEPAAHGIDALAQTPAGTPVATAAVPLQGSLDIAPVSERAGEAFAADFTEHAPSRHRATMGLIVVLLGLALTVQLTYALRDTLVATWPGSRPLLERACALSGCILAWPKRSDLLAIESSDLQADPANSRRIVLTAAVRNRGDVAVARPALELTLTNAQDQTLARRIFLPADYLPHAADASGPMPALAEVNVRLELDTAQLKPAGYRLFLFYP